MNKWKGETVLVLETSSGRQLLFVEGNCCRGSRAEERSARQNLQNPTNMDGIGLEIGAGVPSLPISPVEHSSAYGVHRNRHEIASFSYILLTRRA
jgi:hypothetical protein